MARWIPTIVLIFSVPLSAGAQPSTLDLTGLRAKAQAEGSVQVTVVTRAVSSAVSTGLSTASPEQRKAMRRAQDKILIRLISRGLVVGNEIFVQPDGSFSIRVLPDGLEQLAQSADVAEMHSPQLNQSGDRR